MSKDKYFTFITCTKCGQGEGTLKKDGKGGYVHVKCPPKKIEHKIEDKSESTKIETRPVTQVELDEMKKDSPLLEDKGK